MKKHKGLTAICTACEGDRHTDSFTKVLFLIIKMQKIRLIIETGLPDRNDKNICRYKTLLLFTNCIKFRKKIGFYLLFN